MRLSLQRCKYVSGDHRWIHHPISCVHLSIVSPFLSLNDGQQPDIGAHELVIKRLETCSLGSSCLCNNIQDKPFFEDSNTLPKPFKRKLWVILGWVAEIMHQMHQLLGIVSPSIFIYSCFLNHSRWLARILPSTSDMKILSKGDRFKAGDIFHQEVTAYRCSNNWKHTNWQQQKHMLQKQCKHTITSLKRISFK